MTPLRGLVSSTVALSVMTSTNGSSSRTASPSFLIQRTISPSWMPSPMSGSLNLKVMGLALRFLEVDDLFDRGEHLVGVRHVEVLQRVRERCVVARDALDGRQQVLDGVLRDG